jgi:putative FmdB family regulatory protein
MPIYEFECRKCRRRFEVLFRSFNDKPKVVCERCGSGRVTRAMSVFGMISKGSDGGSRSGPGCASCRRSSCVGCR